MIAPVSSVPSKMCKTTLKKQFLDIEKSAERERARPAPVKADMCGATRDVR
jgi:hypothetical protein